MWLFGNQFHLLSTSIDFQDCMTCISEQFYLLAKRETNCVAHGLAAMAMEIGFWLPSFRDPSCFHKKFILYVYKQQLIFLISEVMGQSDQFKTLTFVLKKNRYYKLA